MGKGQSEEKCVSPCLFAGFYNLNIWLSPKAPLEQLEPHYVEIIDKKLTFLTWENTEGAIEHPEDNEFEYVNVVKDTSPIKCLFIRTLFNPEVELVIMKSPASRFYSRTTFEFYIIIGIPLGNPREYLLSNIYSRFDKMSLPLKKE